MPSPSVVTPKAGDANHESCPMPFHLARSFAVLTRFIHRLHIQYIHTNGCFSWNDIKLKILALCSYESTIPQNPSLLSDIPKNPACQDAMKSRDHWSSIWYQWRSYKWPGRNKPRGVDWIVTVLSCKKSFHLCRELLQTFVRTTWTSKLIWKSAVYSFLRLLSLKKQPASSRQTLPSANLASLHMFFFNVVAVYKLRHSIKTPHWSGTSINSSLRSTMLHPPTSHPPLAPGGVKILDCGRCIGPGRDACACICSICPAKGGGGIDIQGYA